MNDKEGKILSCGIIETIENWIRHAKKNDALFPSEIKKLEEFADYFYLINQRYVKMDNFDPKCE